VDENATAPVSRFVGQITPLAPETDRHHRPAGSPQLGDRHGWAVPSPQGPASPDDPAACPSTWAATFRRPAATTASASRSIPPGCAATARKLDNGCRHAHSTQRQSPDQKSRFRLA